MANSFDEKYKANIAGLAKANNVDMSVGADMLRSNLAGTTQYKGGGVLDFGQANKDLQAFRSQEPTQTQKTPQSDLYALQEKKRLQALESARQKGLASLKAEKEQINPYYNQALSVVGGQSNLGARNLQEYLAQRGQTNAGVSAQAELNRQSDLNTNFANIENERAGRFSDIARRETEVQNAYDEGTVNAALQTEIDRSQGNKEDFLNTIGAYSNDYQAQINQLTNDGDSSNDWQIPYINQARNEKIAALQQAQAEAEQQAFENYLKQIEVEYKINKPYFKPTVGSGGSGGGGSGGGGSYSGASLTKDQAFYQDMQLVDKGKLSPEQIEALSMDLIGQYGLSKYKQLLEAAKKTYVPFSGVADFRILAGEQ